MAALLLSAFRSRDVDFSFRENTLTQHCNKAGGMITRWLFVIETRSQKNSGKSLIHR